MLILNLIAFAALVYGLAFGVPAAVWALCKRLGLPCEIEDFTGRADCPRYGMDGETVRYG